MSKSLRRQIADECKNYKTNYTGIETLYHYENDAYMALNGEYGFEHCPQTYECLKDAEELCETDNECTDDSVKECAECWKKALGE